MIDYVKLGDDFTVYIGEGSTACLYGPILTTYLTWNATLMSL